MGSHNLQYRELSYVGDAVNEAIASPARFPNHISALPIIKFSKVGSHGRYREQPCEIVSNEACGPRPISGISALPIMLYETGQDSPTLHL